MINQTKFAVAVTDLKPVLKGELFEIENGTLTLVALDGYRLAVRYEPIKYDGSLKFVVPAKTLSEIAALLGDNDEETASVYLSKNHVVFELNGYLVYSRLIEGEFHPYKSAIPTTYTTEVIVDRKELIAALERSLILISDRTPSPARCYFENNSIKINCSTSVGKITDEIKADIAGPVIEIGFKCKYLLVLKSLWHITSEYPLCKSLYNRSLTYTRLTDQYRVVLRLTRKDTDNVTNLRITANDRVKFLLSCPLDQIISELLHSLI